MTEMRSDTPLLKRESEANHHPRQEGAKKGFGHTPEQFKEFNNWAIDVLGRPRTNHPWAKFVFPGQLVDPGQHVDFWKANLEAIRQFDAFGVHCYWQQHNHLSRDWGACYQVAHELVPDKPIVITEFGDSTNERSPADKIPFYQEWYAEVDKQPYILGTAVYILGGTPDWIERPGVPNFDVTDDMARAIGQLPRRAGTPLVSEPPALRSKDFDTFAALHFGGRQAARYATTMRAAVEAFGRLSPV